MNDPQELHTLLRQHIGSETFYRHPLMRHPLVGHFIYTEGVRAFAENAGGGAYWFLDILATEQVIQQLALCEGFAVVDLNVKPDHSATVVMAKDAQTVSTPEDRGYDGVVFDHAVGWTDCPEGTWRFYLCANELDGVTLMLTSEY